MPRHKSFHWWTEEEVEFLRKYRPTMHFPEMRELFIQTFGCEVTVRALEKKCHEQHIYHQDNGRFKKGYVPPNKGKHISEEHKAKISKTMFKKGNKPTNSLPLGTKVVKEGYTRVKTKEGWVYQHLVVWRRYKGDVPKGYMIRHLDGNNSNDNIENLIMVSKSANVIFNKRFKLTDDVEINKSMFIRAELISKICKKEKEIK